MTGLWRLAGCATVVTVLSGPAPGSVGSCDEAAVLVDAPAFCGQREAARCERSFQRGLRGWEPLQSEAERDDCLQQAADLCEGARYPEGCFPTERERDRCLSALRSVERLPEPDEALLECTAAQFCGPGYQGES